MPKHRVPIVGPVMAGTYLNLGVGGDEEYWWWQGEPGSREALVVRTDRFGQRWELLIESTHWVTHRVAAGLLNVSTPTIRNWVADGTIKETKKLSVPHVKSMNPGKITMSETKFSVVPLKEVERLANEMGFFLRTPTPPKRRLRGGTTKPKKRKGGDQDADKG